jgi:hypothetical protein
MSPFIHGAGPSDWLALDSLDRGGGAVWVSHPMDRRVP